MFNSDLDRAEQPEAETIAERLLQRISESTESTIQEIVRYVEQVVSGTGEYGLGEETKLKVWRAFLAKGGFELIDGFLKTKLPNASWFGQILFLFGLVHIAFSDQDMASAQTFWSKSQCNARIHLTNAFRLLRVAGRAGQSAERHYFAVGIVDYCEGFRHLHHMMAGEEFNRQKEMFSFIDPDEYLDAAHFIWFHPSQAWTSDALEIAVMNSTSLLFHTLAACGHLTGKRALPILTAVGVSGAADRLRHLLTNPIYCGEHNMTLFEGIIHIFAQFSLKV